MNRHISKRTGLAGQLVTALGVLALCQGLTPALASDTAAGRPAIGDTTVFATVPAPGHPFGVAVDKDRIYISTSAGDFFASPATGGHLNSDGERVFAYDKGGNLVSTTSITTIPRMIFLSMDFLLPKLLLLGDSGKRPHLNGRGLHSSKVQCTARNSSKM